MRKILLATVLCAVCLAARGQQGQTYRMTLQDCLAFAIENNYSRQSTELDEESKAISYQQSKKDRLPNLSASVSESFSHTSGSSASIGGNYGLSTSVTLFQGGSVNNAIEQSRLQSEQATYQLAQYDNELAIQIIETFMSALGNEELLKYQQAVLAASEEQVRRGRVMYEEGQILESDYLMFEAQLASDKDNITSTQITRDNNLRSLKNLLSLDPLVELDIIAPDSLVLSQMGMLPAQDYVLERGMETLPDIAISEYNVDIAQTAVKISKAGYYPTVSMSGSIGTGHAKNFNNFGDQLSDRLNQQVGVSVSIPIYSKGRNKSQVAQSQISLRQAELGDKQTKLNIRQNLVQEYQNLVAAQSKFESSAISENAYKRSFEASQAQFDEGSLTPVELLQQQNNYISAMNNFIQSKYTFFTRRKVLDVYMGFAIKM